MPGFGIPGAAGPMMNGGGGMAQPAMPMRAPGTQVPLAGGPPQGGPPGVGGNPQAFMAMLMQILSGLQQGGGMSPTYGDMMRGMAGRRAPMGPPQGMPPQMPFGGGGGAPGAPPFMAGGGGGFGGGQMSQSAPPTVPPLGGMDYSFVRNLPQ